MTQVKFILYNFFNLLSFTPIQRRSLSPRLAANEVQCYTYKNDMEDFLITLQVSFIDTQTGEIFFTSQFSKPLSIFCQDLSNYCKYFDSFFRGVRLRKHVAMNLSIVNDRDIPQVVESKLCF